MQSYAYRQKNFFLSAVNIFGRWEATLVQRVCLLRQLSRFQSRHLSKIQIGRHKQRSFLQTLARRKNLKKNIYGRRGSVWCPQKKVEDKAIANRIRKLPTKLSEWVALTVSGSVEQCVRGVAINLLMCCPSLFCSLRLSNPKTYKLTYQRRRPLSLFSCLR